MAKVNKPESRRIEILRRKREKVDSKFKGTFVEPVKLWSGKLFLASRIKIKEHKQRLSSKLSYKSWLEFVNNVFPAFDDIWATKAQLKSSDMISRLPIEEKTINKGKGLADWKISKTLWLHCKAFPQNSSHNLERGAQIILIVVAKLWLRLLQTFSASRINFNDTKVFLFVTTMKEAFRTYFEDSDILWDGASSSTFLSY